MLVCTSYSIISTSWSASCLREPPWHQINHRSWTRTCCQKGCPRRKRPLDAAPSVWFYFFYFTCVWRIDGGQYLNSVSCTARNKWRERRSSTRSVETLYIFCFLSDVLLPPPPRPHHYSLLFICLYSSRSSMGKALVVQRPTVQ